MERMHSRWLMLLAPAAMALMTVGQYFIWIYAPEEATMGLVQKIFIFTSLWRGGPLPHFSGFLCPASLFL